MILFNKSHNDLLFFVLIITLPLTSRMYIAEEDISWVPPVQVLTSIRRRAKCFSDHSPFFQHHDKTCPPNTTPI